MFWGSFWSKKKKEEFRDIHRKKHVNKNIKAEGWGIHFRLNKETIRSHILVNKVEKNNTLERVRFQTVTLKPWRSKLTAIAFPIIPIPRNPISSILFFFSFFTDNSFLLLLLYSSLLQILLLKMTATQNINWLFSICLFWLIHHLNRATSTRFSSTRFLYFLIPPFVFFPLLWEPKLSFVSSQ